MESREATTTAGADAGSGSGAAGGGDAGVNSDYAAVVPVPGRVVMVVGEDIFAAERGSVLIHACNCLGSWGAGIALAFREKYPAAYNVYRAHCATRGNPSTLLGTALLIPPQLADAREHWIACLFTSVGYGRRVDAPDEILRSTKASLENMVAVIAGVENDDMPHGGASTTAILGTGIHEDTPEIGELHACKINSGRFGVDWERTKRVIEEVLTAEGKGRVVTAYEFSERQDVENFRREAMRRQRQQRGHWGWPRGGRGGRGRGRGMPAFIGFGPL
ncbi:ADP-ribose 1''-phosphate phosphatase [Orbilia brochopaga]|uniref:ADP-ribose 1''-phosphate phosphatase n=1 Tax=Orbilia brochopaga TaxID=3140254 RepID=A0AAV9UQJ0_9PEZI